MTTKDYKRIYEYVDNDDITYIVFRNKKIVSLTPPLVAVLEAVESMSMEKYIPLNANRPRYGRVSLHTIPKKGWTNAYLIRHRYMAEITDSLGLDIDRLIRDGVVFVYSVLGIRAQQQRKRDRYRNVSVFMFGKADDNLKSWAKDTKKKLDKETTIYEHRLYKRLNRSLSRRVRAQAPFIIKGKSYFADICIKSRKLIIEVDGGYHNTEEQKEYDAKRDRAFRSIGYTTIRITNDQIKDKQFLQDFCSSVIRIARDKEARKCRGYELIDNKLQIL